MKKFISLSFIVFIIDRLLKIIVQNFLVDKIYIIKNFFYLVFTKNIGAAFSIMEGMQIVLVLIGLVALGLIFMYVRKNNSKSLGYPLLFGGILGNIFDRVIFGYVIDFIGFELFNYKFPIFNFADMCIVIGAFIVLIGSDKDETSSK